MAYLMELECSCGFQGSKGKPSKASWVTWPEVTNATYFLALSSLESGVTSELDNR